MNGTISIRGIEDEGAPLKFESPELLQGLIDIYFQECIDKGTFPTITELALKLDTTRQLFCEYEKRKDRFSDTIKRAKTYIEAQYERMLLTTTTPAGLIFNLKNNFKWKDTVEIDHTIKFKDPIVVMPVKEVESNTQNAIDITPDKDTDTPPDKSDKGKDIDP